MEILGLNNAMSSVNKDTKAIEKKPSRLSI